jgi:hypothetical protein
MTRYEWGLIVWGAWLALFLALELMALFRIVPWPTLSRTAWDTEDAWAPIQFVILIGLAVLLVHIVAGGPVKLAAAGVSKLIRPKK